MDAMRCWYLLALCALACAQTPQETGLAPERLLLVRIKVAMESNLEELPNYTCSLTVERSIRRAQNQRFQLMDALRLEVALVNGKELYSWPGEKEFRDEDLTDMIDQGAISTGAFALHARSVFLSNTAEFTYVGEEDLDGRRAVRYDFRIPQYRSGYRIRIGTASGIAGEHGSFWADPDSLDLLRLTVVAEDIPTNVPILGAEETLDYARAPIGSSIFLLPKASEMTITDFKGNVSRNRTSFANCRQYTGESEITFGEAPSTTPAPAAPTPAPAAGETATAPQVRNIELPPGIFLETELVNPIDLRKAAIGDEVEMLVRKRAMRKGVVVPKGARLLGRISRLVHRRSQSGAYIVLGLRFPSVDFPGASAPFHANLARAENFQAFGSEDNQSLRHAFRSRWDVQSFSDEPEDGEGVFYVSANAGQLRRGFVLSWYTIEAPTSRNK